MRQVKERALPLILVLSAWLLLPPARSVLADINPHASPLNTEDGLLSTNWIAFAKAALPAKYRPNGMLGFQETTNLLCRESRRENYPAKGLWGIALVVESHSPENTEEGLRLMRASGDHGYVPAMLTLGWMFELGQFVRADYAAAFHWYSLAAERGDAVGEFELGWCYHHAVGTSQDLKKAAQFYRRAADQKNYLAMKSIGFLLLHGFGVKQDLKAARYWLERAAKEGGSRRAMLNLGALCAMKYPDGCAIAEAFKWYRQSADLGDPVACLAVSEYYSGGWGVASNLDNSRVWRRKAADFGSTEAQYRMGAAYQLGDGVPKNESLAMGWYLRAAAKNHPMALHELAKHYFRQGTNPVAKSMGNQFLLRAAEAGHRDAQFVYAVRCFLGETGPLNEDLGDRWLAKAANNGWGPAEMYLSQLFYQGIPPAPGCRAYPRNVVEGVKLLRLAAGHKDLQAQTKLAYMLLHGKDVARDQREGERLLRDAAEHGFAMAQNDLGYSIFIGLTSSSNLVEAGVWCRLAASNTTDPLIAKRAMVNESSVMWLATDDQWIDVERKVKAFHATPVEQLNPLVSDWENNFNYRSEDGIVGTTSVESKWRMSKP